ncbi:MAG TPA: phosphoribosylformylglycinamidine synthase subunit PurQ [Alphaproteobacteria bacterium]|jgi:phosphoribosylformylglycinamidine synthase|nr:phosphoribosylformylglycinamidine synthase subunit PurQ [Alphaproteobacteria bacterium]MDP6271668.1 phosphoribosylformylglycinamidine synthase subunit PurQ [Alphaproteobacteria bacterium]HJM51310.1 phosphoribosylformylglycinamidine synthase subunit PurQ [Alphaproteobacteria bacterium]
MKSVVIIFPGSNRDSDVCYALAQVSGRPPATVWHRDTELPDCDLIVLPGGFSYGDYLRSGAMAAGSPIMRQVVARATTGVAVLGICNGFQTLTEAGLLPGALMPNRDLKFICRNVHLQAGAGRGPFAGGYAEGQVISIPVAHHDGNYFADPETLDELEGEGRVAFRYCDAEGGVAASSNPNGSARSIAGIFNTAGNVLGLMPHPENHIEEAQGSSDGRALFENLARSLA